MSAQEESRLTESEILVINSLLAKIWAGKNNIKNTLDRARAQEEGIASTYHWVFAKDLRVGDVVDFPDYPDSTIKSIVMHLHATHSVEITIDCDGEEFELHLRPKSRRRVKNR